MRTIRSFTCVLLAFAVTPALAADWDAGGGERWDKIMAAAKQEGGVTTAVCAELSSTIARDFKADTGLDITFLPGNSQELLTRYRAELNSGRVGVDVRTGGPSELEFVKSGQLLDLNEILFLPSVISPDRWQNGEMTWIDNDRKYLNMPAEYVSTRPIINKDVIAPGTIKTWTDLMKPEFKGKIAAYDPTVNGAGQTFGAYLSKIHGIDFVVKLFNDQQVVVARDSRQLGEWAARGLYPIVLGLDALYFDRLRAQGITSLEWVTPDDGPGSLVGGCAALSIPKNAPHPNAAIVFANWYLSPRGQAAMEEAAHYPSRRTDLSHEKVSAYFLPDPTKTYLNQYREDWYTNDLVKIRAELKERLKTLVGN